jgi:hypothetical protein
MANAIKYSESVVPLTLRKGDFYLLTGNEIFGTTSATGFWNGYDLTNAKYVIYLNRPSNGPSIYAPANDNELIAITNKIANTNYSTASECIVWFATQSDKMVVNKTYPPIVTNGLVLNLDAGFLPSYPTSGTTWYDLSGTNDGTLTNGPTFNNNGYITFDGVDDRCPILNQTFNSTSESSFTIEIYFKRNSTTSGTARPLYSVGNGTSSTNARVIFFFDDNSNGSMAINYYVLGGLDRYVTLDSQLLNTRFHQAVQVVNKNSLQMTGYFDGVNKGSGSITNSSTSDTTFRIGGGSSVNASISLLRIYNRALSVQEVLQNYYQAPIVTDGLIFAVDAGNIVSYESGSTTTYSLTGSLSGSLINGTGYLPNNGGVWDLDGTDDYIDFPDNNILDFGTGSFTIECFFKPDSTQSGGNSPAIMNKSVGNFSSPAAGVTGWILYWRTSVNQYQFQLGDSSAAVNSVFFPGTVNNDNTWRHLVVTIPSGNNTIKGYYNGNLVASGTRTLTGSTDTDVNLTLGTWRQFARELNTELSVARIYNRELSAQEVSQNFNAQRSRFGI